MVVSDDRVLLTAVDSHTSSSAINAPEENGKSDEIVTANNLNDFVKCYPKNKLVHTNLEKEKKQQCSSKCKIGVELSKSTLRCKILDSKQLNNSNSTSNQAYKKQPRKCDNPVRLLITESSDQATMLSCKNSACKAILSSEDKFCRKCSCCVCHLFDDKKDPSLWLVCRSESGDGDWCGLSCHIECALQHKKAGVVDHGQFMQLDGSYCCASCGKVSDIIGFWKQQLAVAKDAHQVDILFYRISLSYRLLNGTSKFKELHKMVEDAMRMMETEVGPLNGMSARIFRGNVSRLSVVNDLQSQCSFAIMKAEEFLNSVNGSIAKHRDSPPTACAFHFEEISSSSLVIVLNVSCSSAPDVIKGYKLCYCKSREEMIEKDPVLIPRSQQRILVPNLQPCTEYVFRIISLSDDGNLGHTESKCFTRGVEVIDKDTKQTGTGGCSINNMRESKNPIVGSSGFKVRNLGKIFGPAWAMEEGCSDDLYQEDDVEEESYIGGGVAKPLNADDDRRKASVPHQLDLNVASVPDLNDDLSLPMEFSPEENGCTLEKSGLERSNGSGNCHTCAVRVVEVPAVESQPDCRKNLTNGFTDGCDGDSTLVSAPPHEFSFRSSNLDDNYEYCVNVIRRLECLGHIEKDFRMKFLTWFSFSSTEQERWVVITFIRTLIEEPSCLAGQLLDAFLEIVNCKRPRNGFCSKLWH
ncbi:VIN3-like protein 1 [Dendrobium catenatum]|uniref:VIN3-like protein 1 n=1 Tax=Dendrobium catenatum TaxID=906689 RepID=A0A2I0VXH1_9ASPA|nr:VIN3-like protein 1 [Dendrobium catenatum]PKU68108.1 VIN3-like protein 1 [Dendrobium catenatum]